MSQSTMDKLFKDGNLKHFDYSNRLGSFARKWRYDKVKNSSCTSIKLAKAGFVCTGTKDEPDSAKCYVCLHEMIWDAEDDPIAEHQKHRPDCELVKLNKSEQEFSVRNWLRLLAYAYTTLQYDAISDSVANLSAIMEKFVMNADCILQS